MFGYRCQECGKGRVRPTRVSNYKARLGNQVVVIPTATIGICDVCGAKHYSAAERKRWMSILSQKLKHLEETKRGKQLTLDFAAKEWRALQRIANRRGVFPEELVKRWVLERLSQEG
jgi:YgiT-type zinc finger domain-containing protein